MRNFFEENNKIIKKPRKLSKNDIIKKINNITTVNTPLINKYNKNLFDKKYLNRKKKNLTYVNLYDYNYDHVDISDKKIKNPVLKLKQEIHYDTDYSSFLSKNSNNYNSQLLITGLNSIKKNKIENKYNNMLSEYKRKINTYIDNKKKSPSKSKTSYNLSYNNNMIFSPNSLKSYIHFNKDVFYNPLKVKGENLASFMEKSRIIRREKMRKYILEDKVYTLIESKKEAFNIIQIIKDEYFKNLALQIKYAKCLDRYLRYLERKETKEFQFNENLKYQIKQLKYEIHILNKKLKYLKYEKNKYEDIRKFLISTKYGYEAIKNKDKNKEDISLFLTDSNDYEDFEKSSKNIKISNTMNKKDANNINESAKKLPIKKYYFPQITSNNIIFNANQEKNEKTKIRKSYSTELIMKKKKKFKLNYIFANFENSILNSIYSYNNKQKNIINLKNNLSESKYYSEREYIYEKMKISTKTRKLFFLKKENKELKSKYNTIKKTTTVDDGLKNNIENKIYNLLIDMNNEINIQEAICIKNLFSLLKLKPEEFMEKTKLTRLIYMIKIVELIFTFLINSKIKYSHDPKLKEKYYNIKNIVLKDKNLRILKLNREKLKLKLEERKLKFIKKSTQIRFFTYKKYDIKNIKPNKRRVVKKNISNNNDSKINYEKWLTYT